MDKEKALVLGGTNPHIELIRNLKDKNFYVILVDYLPNPPAKKYADMHIMESTLDKDKVLEIAKVCGVSLVVTTNIDQANVTACYVAEKLDLPHPYTYETALNVTDKKRMKGILKANRINTSDYLVVSVIDTIKDVPFPVVVKPIDSNGSRGVHRCNNIDELNKYFIIAKKASRAKEVIIEQFIEGDEVSFYYYIQDFVPHYITSNQRFKFQTDDNSVMQSGGGIYPAQQSKEVYEKMDSIASSIAKAFSLKNTPIFIQAIVAKEDVFVLEFAPRIGGGLSFRLIEQDNKFDIIDAAVNSFLGKKSVMNIVQPSYCSATMNVYAPGITIKQITGTEEVLNSGLAREFYRYKLDGSEVSHDMSSGSRVGCFFIQGESVADVVMSIEEINNTIEVYSSDGRRAMRHDIYKSIHRFVENET